MTAIAHRGSRRLSEDDHGRSRNDKDGTEAGFWRRRASDLGFGSDGGGGGRRAALVAEI